MLLCCAAVLLLPVAVLDLQDLQRQVKLYFRSVTNLNIFLADTLTLDQALLLNVACECGVLNADCLTETESPAQWK